MSPNCFQVAELASRLLSHGSGQAGCSAEVTWMQSLGCLCHPGDGKATWKQTVFWSFSLGSHRQQCKDTAKVAALAKVDAELGKLNCYESFGEVSGVLNRTLVPTERLSVLIDFPTSKTRMVVGRIEELGTLLQSHGHGQGARVPPLKVRVLITCGSRIGLVGAVQLRLQAVCPTLAHYVVMITSGRYHGTRAMQYAVVALDPESAKDKRIPHSIEALAVRAKRGECTRLRCLDQDCGLRSTQESLEMAKVAGDKHPDIEIDPEHLEEKFADCVEEEEGEEDVVVVVEGVKPTGPGRAMVRDLWPFAMPRDYYKGLMSGILDGETSSHALVLTGTAHPASTLAFRDLSMTVHVVMYNVKGHSRSHGQKVLKDQLYAELYAVERASSRHDKRVLERDATFITVRAPLDQPVRFDSVELVAGTWRSGIDLTPTSETLERQIPKLIFQELEAMGLRVQDINGQKRLVAARGLSESDVVGHVSSLLFSSRHAAVEFLNLGGNAALLEGPMFELSGLACDAADGEGDSSTKSVFAIPLGAGRLLADWRGTRRFPNIRLEICPEKGASDGLLSMRVSTHNSCGIAAGSVLACEFGEQWESKPEAIAHSPARKFRGALQALFAEQTQSAAAAAGSDGPTPATKRLRTDETPAPGPAPTAAPAAAAKTAGAAAAAPKQAEAPASTAAASVAGQASAETGASPAKRPRESGPAAPSAVAVPSAVAASSGDLVVATVDQYEVRLSGATVKIVNMLAKPRKIAPKTVLMTWTGGRLEDSAKVAVAMEFVFKKASELVVMPKSDKFDVGSISHFVETTQAAALYQHGKFAAGKSPTSFAVKQKSGYVPAASESAPLLATVKGVGSSTTAKMLWVLTLSDGGKLVPHGLALVVTKQIVIGGMAEVSL